MSRNTFQSVLASIDIYGATRHGTEKNDLLPPRLEDRVIGEVGRRFSESLVSKFSRGRYDPTPAVFVSVPKAGHTTRPAALLTLGDRVVYEALVDALRPRIDSAMIGPEIAFWPRGSVTPKQWRTFEASSVVDAATHIGLADITAFYESIEHERVRDTLTELTGRREVVDALVEFLNRVMASSRGIPQGLSASDAIATAYLTPLDHSMSRECVEYRRHGDDFRISARSYSETKRILSVLEGQLRRTGLLLSGSKALIMAAGRYKSALDEGDRTVEQTRMALLHDSIEALRGDQDAISDLLKRAGRDDLGWDFFYHGSVSFEDMVAQLTEHISASDAQVAARVFVEAMNHSPTTAEPLAPEVFHHRVTSSLARLAAAKSDAAIGHVSDLLGVAPEKTDIVAGYLLSARDEDAPSVVRAVFEILESERFRTSWEKSWLMQVVGKFSEHVPAGKFDVINAIARDENEQAMTRVEALKALAKMGSCDQSLVRRLWNTQPIVFHPDLVAAVHAVRASAAWSAAFLDGVRDDPINVVVLSHLAAVV